jgi:hypothetical protein
LIVIVTEASSEIVADTVPEFTTGFGVTVVPETLSVGEGGGGGAEGGGCVNVVARNSRSPGTSVAGGMSLFS